MLTKRQKEVLDFVESYSHKKGYAPSFEEIRKRLKLASVSTVHFHVSKLKASGYLGKIDNKARAISISKREPLVKIPLLGTIAAGEPIEAIRQREFISVPKEKLPKSGHMYALRVSGNSMIDENIRDGDVVLVKQQEIAENGHGRGLFFTDEYHKKLESIRLKKKIRSISRRKRCPVCSQKEDADGRCRCVNKDAW